MKDWAQVFSTYRLMQTLKYLRELFGRKKEVCGKLQTLKRLGKDLETVLLDFRA